jgi:dual-specificity kinase
MTFELLGESIWSLVARNRGGFPPERVQDVTVQILQALEYVHAHQIIHSDLKSENVLIASHPDAPGPLYVKLVDFGCGIFASAWHPPIVGTMNYRSPEAVLQADWSYPVDLWGLGCIVVEMVIGRQMFELA